MRMLAATLAACFTSTCLPAHAVLGGDVASVQGDTLRMRAVRRQSVGLDHSVHEIVRPDGARVVQYVNAKGTVFMVQWVQQGKPRMAELLGAFDPEYRAAARTQGRAGVRRQLQIRAGDLVVHASEYLGRHRGTAYLRSQLPQGFVEAGLLR